MEYVAADRFAAILSESVSDAHWGNELRVAIMKELYPPDGAGQRRKQSVRGDIAMLVKQLVAADQRVKEL